MKHLLSGYVIFLCLFFPLKAFSDIHLEPYGGFGVLGHVNKKFSNQLLKDDWYGKLTAGARIGYKKLGLAFGLDISGSQYRPFSDFPEGSFFTVSPGAFASYKLPLLFRIYGTLIPHGFLIKPSEGRNINYIARGLKAGISYLSLPFLSINLEYETLYLDTEEGGWTHSGTVFLNFIL